jgi:adenylyltransferase/sulfurtransferase
MDVVIGCLDNLQARISLNRLCFRAGKTWIDGGIGDLEGQVSVYQAGKSCYECNLTDDERQELGRSVSCAGVVKINEQAGRTATTPVIASLIGAVQVQEAMKFIHPEAIEKGVFSTLAGKLFVYEGKHPSADIFDFSSGNEKAAQMNNAEILAASNENAHASDSKLAAPDENAEILAASIENAPFVCMAHEYWDPVIKVPELDADTTVSQALALIKKALSIEAEEVENSSALSPVCSSALSPFRSSALPKVEINLRNNKFIDRISSRLDNKPFSPMLPESKLPGYIMADEELSSLQISEGFYQHDYENIDDTFPYPSLTLRQIGIPDFDVLQVSTPQGVFYVELSLSPLVLLNL